MSGIRQKIRAGRGPRLNPVLWKELESTLSKPRLFWLVTVYVLVLTLLAYAAYLLVATSLANPFAAQAGRSSALLGQILFLSLGLLELAAVSLLAPALTAGAIGDEVDGGTWELLSATPLRPATLLWGKVLPAWGYLALLLVATLPLASVVFQFGGVTIGQVAGLTGLLAVFALAFSLLGIFFSALTRRTNRATAWSYLVVLLLLFGTTFVWATVRAVSGDAPRALLYLNPLSALLSAATTVEMREALYGAGSAAEFLYMLSGTFARSPLMPELLVEATPVWPYTVGAYGALSLLLYAGTWRLLPSAGGSGRASHDKGRRLGVIVAGMVALLALSLLLWLDDGGQEPGPTPVPARVFVVPTTDHQRGPATPAPTATPAERHGISDAASEEEAIATYLAAHWLPAGERGFCDVQVLGQEQEEPNAARVFVWAYCRSFIADGDELVAGILQSAPLAVHLTANDGEWRVQGFTYGQAAAVLPDEVRARLADAPYDEQDGAAHVQQQAARVLLGE
jgi:ABC-type transport system involved in multi-copper enzyme maturation permease subunit